MKARVTNMSCDKEVHVADGEGFWELEFLVDGVFV